jgi:quercetin dioxygenase-like cupin family protein
MTLTRARLLLAGALTMGGLSLAAAQQPTADNFTGVVTAMDAKDVTAGRRKFEAGARTAWHSHDKGQLIYAESGRMRTGRRGEAFKEYAEGGSEYTPPNIEHWHGATPDSEFTQGALTHGDAAATVWLEQVSDAQYNGR